MRLWALNLGVAALILASMSCGGRRTSDDVSLECASDGECAAGLRCVDNACVGCVDDTECDCHSQCLNGSCSALGAAAADTAVNAHGNWQGTPGEASYQFQSFCNNNDECGFGQLCNPFTKSCVSDTAYSLSCESDPCPNGLECEPTIRRCLPPALCRTDNNCCGYSGFVCQGASDDGEAGVCFARECTPPAEIETTCPQSPRSGDECGGTRFCDPGGKCVFCTCDADCTGGQPRCDTQTGVCVRSDFCRDSTDCDGGQACDTEEGSCVSNCDAGCGPGLACDEEDNVCRCEPDSNEPNEDIEFATTLTAPAVDESLNFSATLCDTDSDWYEMTLTRGSAIEVMVSSLADLSADLFAYAPNGEVLDSGLLVSGLSFVADVDGVYNLRISTFSSTGGDYTMNITRSEGQVCDEGGPNNVPVDAQPFNVTTVAAGCELTQGTLDSSHVISCVDTLRICSGDVDYYEVVAPPGNEISATISNFDADLELHLYGPFTAEQTLGQTPIADSSTSSGGVDESVDDFVRSGGRYLLRVTGFSTAEDSYDLEVTLSTPNECIEDTYDGSTSAAPGDPDGFNDTLSSVSAITIGDVDGEVYTYTETILSDLALCTDDRDWFVLGLDRDGELAPAPAGHRLRVDIVDAPASQPARFFVDSDAAAVQAALQSPSNAVTEAELLSDGELLYVAVTRGGTSTYDYDLRIRGEAPPACDLDGLGDLAEQRNDNPPQAAQLLPPTWPDAVGESYSYPVAVDDVLVSCATDDDWYRIPVPANTALSATISFDADVGELGLAVYSDAVSAVSENSPGNPPDTGLLKDRADDGTGIQAVLVEPGTPEAYILVYNRSAWPVAYELTLAIEAEVCTPDAYEVNDTAATATAVDLSPSPTTPGLETLSLVGLTACDSNKDWYQLNLAAGDQLNIQVPYNPDDGDLDLRLFGPSSSVTSIALDQDIAQDGILEINYTVPAGQTAAPYRILVEAKSGDNENNYTLNLSATRVCADDRYTPATFGNPSAVSLPTEQIADGSLVLCDVDDWYAIQVPAGGDFSVCARFVHADIDLDLELYDVQQMPADATPVAASRTKEDQESVTATATPGQTFWARVYPDFRSPGTIDYGLWILPGAGGCPDLCADTVPNGNETDVDCGGGTCAACGAGQSCTINSDCASNGCFNGVCQ